MVLVAGATGLVGSEVCRLLRSTNRTVTALVRPSASPERVAALRAIGCAIIEGDLREPATLAQACRGAEAVISTASAMPFSWQPGANTISTVDSAGVRSLIDAARGAGVGRMLYVSFSGNIDIDFPLRNAKRDVEAYLRESGMRYTILRPSYFMEVWLSPAVGFDYAAGRATIYGSGQAPVSWIGVPDVARFVAASLDNPAALNATIELGGPEARSLLDVVRIFESVAERPFERAFVPEGALVAQQESAQDDMQRSFAGLMRCYAAGDAIAMQATLRAFRLELTPVRDYALRVVAPQALAAAR